MASRFCSLLSLVLLPDSYLALRRASKKSRGKADHVACPVMGALVNNGVIKLDSQGRATQEDTVRGLMWTGNTLEMAGFQAKGIAAFKDEDTYQEYRERSGDYKGPLYLNYNTWNPYSQCNGTSLTDSNGMACNANKGFQQHGFSTTLRDPTDGSGAGERWDKWMRLPGVMTRISGVRGKVMTIQGMGALLKEARLNGDKNGEFSLTSNNQFRGSYLEFYHPSASSHLKSQQCFQWQAIGAWAAFWVVFARYTDDGVSYITENDLRGLFFDARFPRDWKPFPWGFKETMKAARELKGTGAGEEWVAVLSGILAKVGEEAADVYYAGGLLGALEAAGARDDDVFKTRPGR